MKTYAIASILLLTAALVAQGTIAAGTYKGKWNGATGGGDIHITFRDGAARPEIGFTLDGQEVACKVISFEADRAKFKLVYEFDLQGTRLQSATEATWKGKTIEGAYKTTAGDQAVDSGTWSATAP
jgi:hypothetical protein